MCIRDSYEDEQISVATSYFDTDDEEVLALRKTYADLLSLIHISAASDSTGNAGTSVSVGGGVMISGGGTAIAVPMG